jgi:hypothetical protein
VSLSLALLEEVDITDLDSFAPWAAEAVEDRMTIDERLALHTEDDVRWAITAAHV